MAAPYPSIAAISKSKNHDSHRQSSAHQLHHRGHAVDMQFQGHSIPRDALLFGVMGTGRRRDNGLPNDSSCLIVLACHRLEGGSGE